MNPAEPSAQSVAIGVGRVLAVGDDRAIRAMTGPATRVVEVGGRRVVRGLHDWHLHVIRGGLNENMELRLDSVPSLADAMRLPRAQVADTPLGEWVHLVGGFAELQLAERRLPRR